MINTSYLADSYTVFTLKLVSGQNFWFSRWIRSSTYGKQNISDFPSCGKGKREGGKIITIVYHFHNQKFWADRSQRFDSSVSRATDNGSKDWWYEFNTLFFSVFFFFVIIIYFRIFKTDKFHNFLINTKFNKCFMLMKIDIYHITNIT